MSQHRKNSTRCRVIDKEWSIEIGRLWGLQEARWESAMLESLLGYSFIIKRKVGTARRPSLSFLSRHPASIISFSKLSRGVFLSFHGQARSTNYCFLCVQRTCPNLLSSLGRMLGLMPLLFYCLGACLVLLLLGLVAKQACLVLRLGKPFSSNR